MWAEAFGYGIQDLSDAGDWGAESLEGSVSTRREFVVARLAEEILDRIMKAMVPVADEGMDGWVGIVIVVTVGVGTSLAAGINVLLAAPRALSLRIRHHHPNRRHWRGGDRISAVRAVVRCSRAEKPQARPGSFWRRRTVVEAAQFEQQTKE